jgi:hypothetical protein
MVLVFEPHDTLKQQRILPIGLARLIPPRTPRLKMALRKPLSCRNQMSEILAGTSASMGAMQKPMRAREPAREPKDLDSAHQKQDTIRPIEEMM